MNYGHNFTDRSGGLASRLFLALTFGAVVCAQPFVSPLPPASATEYGPPNGLLVIAGGGDLRGTGITEAFIARAGGSAAKIVIVPTAGGNRHPDGQVITYEPDQVLATWKRQHGLTHVTMLHTHDPKVADTVQFVQALRAASGVWFNGGRQWNLVDSYANTLTEREFHAVLARGGVIGGSSAGATIQGDYLVRGAVAGPNIVMAPEPEHQRAFAFLRRSAIDQHVDTRNRWEDLIPVIRKFPTFLGIGLSESTAIIVKGDRFEVIGRGQVAIHDHTRPIRPGDKSYFLLSAGDSFDLKLRTAGKISLDHAPASAAQAQAPTDKP